MEKYPYEQVSYPFLHQIRQQQPFPPIFMISCPLFWCVNLGGVGHSTQKLCPNNFFSSLKSHECRICFDLDPIRQQKPFPSIFVTSLALVWCVNLGDVGHRTRKMCPNNVFSSLSSHKCRSCFGLDPIRQQKFCPSIFVTSRALVWCGNLGDAGHSKQKLCPNNVFSSLSSQECSVGFALI